MSDAPYFERERFAATPEKLRYLEYLVGRLRRESILPPARLLDIGSGTGLFVTAAEAAGYQVTGIESSSHAAALARARVHGTILCHDANRPFDLPDGAFDVVTMLDVIEHLTEWAGALRESRRVLKPGGVLVVVTLNAHSIARPLLGRRWAWYQDPTHVALFSRATLRSAILEAGFDRLRMTTIFNFLTAGESFPPLRVLRGLGGVLSIPWFGDSLLAIASR